MLITRLALLAAAIIHFLPLAGVLGIDQLARLYGVAIDEPNLLILMRHRAVLFGLLGAFLALAAFRPALQGMALLAGFTSVATFVAFAFAAGGYNAEIARVVMADFVALACLCVGAATWLWNRSIVRR